MKRRKALKEKDWLAAEDPIPMLEYLDEKASGRKLRLFTVAYCRRLLRYFDTEARRAVEAAEKCADGQLTEQELWKSWGTIGGGGREHFCSVAAATGFSVSTVHAAYQELAISMSRMTCSLASMTARRLAGIVGGEALGHKADDYMLHLADRETELDEADHLAAGRLISAEKVSQAALLRDIFGNPFRSVSFAPEWRTSTAVAIAKGMYESRDFSAMPILADALQDAGCENEIILSHCRGDGPHVRGCWVVDLVLGKE